MVNLFTYIFCCLINQLVIHLAPEKNSFVFIINNIKISMLKVSVRESVCIVVVYVKQILEIIIKLFTYIKFLMILYILFFFFYIWFS